MEKNCLLLLMAWSDWMSPSDAEASNFSICSARCSRRVFRTTDRDTLPNFRKVSAEASVAQLPALPAPASGNARARSAIENDRNDLNGFFLKTNKETNEFLLKMKS